MSDVVNISIIFGSIATITIAVCTVIGLFTRKGRHNRKRESNLASQLLVSIRKYEDTMNDSISLPKEGKVIDFLRRNREEEYQNRDLLLNKEIYLNILASKDFWGKEMRLIFNEMLQMEESVKKSDKKICDYLFSIQTSDGCGDYYISKKDVDIDSMRDEREELSKQLDELVKKAEGYLKPKIRL